MFRVIVAGSRGFRDYDLLRTTLDKLLANKLPDVLIISGCAAGADALGEKYAAEKGLQVKRMPAEWNKYGKSAGYKRNEAMAKEAEALVAFWDGKSPGTRHMIEIARREGLAVRVVRG